MSIIKLSALDLENFKGVRRFGMSLNGEQSINVLGENASGKSSLLDAYLWLLFGKNSENRKDFEIKPLTESGEPLHGLDSSVNGIFDIDGEELILKKTYKEKYVRRRGSAQEELTGHTVDYRINGVPVREREYQDKIKEIADEKLFRLLSDVRFFNESLSWQERRQILLGACGDISDADVIASDAKLARLPSVIGKRTLDEYRKIATGRKTEINKQIAEIPPRIDEANKSKADTGTATKVTLQDEINTLAALRKSKEDELRRIQEGGEVAEKTKKLREIEGQIQELQNEERAARDDAEREKRLRVQELTDKKAAVNKSWQALTGEKTSILNKQTSIKEQIETLRNEWHRINEKPFTQDVCPTCGQTYPDEQREKALASFNAGKAKTLTEINEQGKAFADNLIALSHTFSVTDEAIQKCAVEIDELSKQITHEELRKVEVDFAADAEQAKLFLKKSNLESEIAALGDGSSAMVEEFKRQIDSEAAAILEKQTLLAQIDSNYRADARIRELMKQEKDLAGEFEELEGNIFLTEEFIRRKVSMLDEKINGKFRTVRFRLFDTQINGGLTECCEATVGGVPYGSLNEASRINCGIEIANVLSEHYGLYLPTWVDGAESITDILPSKSQQIKLIVSKDHPQLTVEGE